MSHVFPIALQSLRVYCEVKGRVFSYLEVNSELTSSLTGKLPHRSNQCLLKIDTMNTASRMESTGKKSRIHLSQETADLLIAAGKSMWVTARDDKVVAKGKGELQTYWLELTDKFETGSTGSGAHEVAESRMLDDSERVSATIAEKTGIDPGKTERLIDWNVEVLLRLLKQVVARRKHQGRETMGVAGTEDLMLKPARGQTVLDEVKEIITLPQFDSSSANIEGDCDYIEINPRVPEQLHDYVWNIGSMYRNNPFHNFEHASHVTMVRLDTRRLNFIYPLCGLF
jgi:Adenylate and Guanylate cyclase catalytic domain